MPLNYGTPPCPQSGAHIPFKDRCPRSDTYRAIESGTVHTVFGYLFRCRTCGTMFFRATKQMTKVGMDAGRLDQLAKQAQQERGH